MVKRVPFQGAEVYFGKWVVTMLYAEQELWVYLSKEDYVKGLWLHKMPYKNSKHAREYARMIAEEGKL